MDPPTFTRPVGSAYIQYNSLLMALARVMLVELRLHALARAAKLRIYFCSLAMGASCPTR